MGTREQIEAFRVAASGRNFQTIFERLETVTESLISLHRELATLLSTEKDGKVRAFMQNSFSTVAERDRHADFQALDVTREIFRVKGEIAAFTEERDYLRLLIGFERG